MINGTELSVKYFFLEKVKKKQQKRKQNKYEFFLTET